MTCKKIYYKRYSFISAKAVKNFFEEFNADLTIMYIQIYTYICVCNINVRINIRNNV